MGVALQSCSRVDLVLFFIVGDLVMGDDGICYVAHGQAFPNVIQVGGDSGRKCTDRELPPDEFSKS